MSTDPVVITTKCEWCGEPEDAEQGPVGLHPGGQFHRGCAESSESGGLATAILEVQAARATVELQLAGVPLFRRQQHFEAWRHAKRALFAAVDSLTEDEMREYGAYRQRVRMEIANRRKLADAVARGR